jgi:translation initiation factor IF-1
MPNTFGGRNFKKIGKKRKSKNPNIAVPTESGIDFHGQVVKRIGGNQIQVRVFSLNDDIIATIPGRFMRKVWFNAGDYVHIQQQGKFYDVIQKLQLDDEISNAKRIQNKNAMTGEEDIFRQDEEEEEDGDFDEIPESESEPESEEDELGNKKPVDKVSTKNISKSEKINSVKINKNNVSADKLRRKLQEKERDLSRKRNTDFVEKPTSIIEKDDESESTENSESKSDDPKSDDINIDDI